MPVWRGPFGRQARIARPGRPVIARCDDADRTAHHPVDQVGRVAVAEHMFAGGVEIEGLGPALRNRRSAASIARSALANQSRPSCPPKPNRCSRWPSGRPGCTPASSNRALRRCNRGASGASTCGAPVSSTVLTWRSSSTKTALPAGRASVARLTCSACRRIARPPVRALRSLDSSARAVPRPQPDERATTAAAPRFSANALASRLSWRMNSGIASAMPRLTPNSGPLHIVVTSTMLTIASDRPRSGERSPLATWRTKPRVYGSTSAQATVGMNPPSTTTGSQASSGAPKQNSAADASAAITAARRPTPPACSSAAARAQHAQWQRTEQPADQIRHADADEFTARVAAVAKLLVEGQRCCTRPSRPTATCTRPFTNTAKANPCGRQFSSACSATAELTGSDLTWRICPTPFANSPT